MIKVIQLSKQHINAHIEQVIHAFNKGWTHGNIELLETLLHDEVIFVAPDLTTEIEGKEACIQTIGYCKWY